MLIAERNALLTRDRSGDYYAWSAPVKNLRTLRGEWIADGVSGIKVDPDLVPPSLRKTRDWTKRSWPQPIIVTSAIGEDTP